MIEISKHNMDGIALGQNKEEISLLLLDSMYELEFEEIADEQEVLVTISVRGVREFVLENRLVNFNTLESFLKEVEVIHGDEVGFVFVPKFNLGLHIDYEDKVFGQVLIYHDSIKDIMESDLSDFGVDEEDMFYPLDVPFSLDFEPYIRLGDYIFGMSSEEFAITFNVRVKKNPDIGVYFDSGDFYFQFDEGNLTQIYLPQLIEMYEVIFQGKNINSAEGLQALVDSQRHIESKLHYTFPELGLSIWKDLSKLYFFDRTQLSSWV
ncbi:hypothetical protein AAEX37_00567 [Oligella sp. MSHR50489EDL]|uniref:hypothetical protein n=1 Tax=Oligella sp. MSHR50489EDL TaxID=3139409 RepID=UPI003D81AF93